MYYTRKSKGSNRTVGIIIVVGFHAALLAAVMLGLGRQAMKKLTEPIKTEIVEQVEIEEEIPPPPPPPTDMDLAPPVDQVVIPDFTFDAPVSTNAIQQVQKADKPAPPPKEPPAPPPPKPQPKPPSERLSAGMPRRFEKPDYPSSSKRLEEEGITTMKVCVDAKGKATEVNVTKPSGFPKLDEAAIEWAYDLRFEPAKVDGKAVDGGCMILPLEWKIED